MGRNSRRAFLSWLFVAALTSLALALAALQYRSIGEVSQGEQERMRRALQANLSRLSQEFNGELLAGAQELRPPEHESMEAQALDAEYLSRFRNWRESARQPNLFARIIRISPAHGRAELRELDQNRMAFVAASWPTGWGELRDEIQARLSSEPGPRGPLHVSNTPLIETPYWGAAAGDQPEEWLVLEVNVDYVRTVFLPELLTRHLGPDSEYDVEVFPSGVSSQAIFRSHEDGSRIGAPNDGSAGLFPVDLRRGQGRGERGEREALGGRWTIAARHRAGSLEAAVGRARNRSVATTSAILLLMLGAIAALIRFTRHSQLLADQQMMFVAGVSHELRTPLTVIRTAAHNIGHGVLDRNNPEQLRRYGDLIRDQAEKLAVIVEQVLRFANTQAGRTLATREPVWVDWLIDNLENAEVEKSVEPDLPPVMGDPVALAHALGNLVSNAAKYGEGWIGLAASAVGDAVEIRVSDRGPGIPREDLGRIFEPFYRGRRAVDDQIPGTGLGLSLVKRIVEAHGGKIEVRSELGRGTDFVVRIPAAPAEKIDEFANPIGGRRTGLGIDSD